MKKIKSLFLILLIFNLFFINACAENKNAEKSELVKTEESVLVDTLIFAGEKNTRYLLSRIEFLKDSVMSYEYDKCNMLTKNIHEDMSILFCKDKITLYENIFGSNDSTYVRLNYDNKKDFLLCKKIADKIIHVNIAKNGSVLLLNCLDERVELYDEFLDNYFWIYNLDSLEDGKLYIDSIKCFNCDDGYIIDDELFFSKCSIDVNEWPGGYTKKDIYKSLWNKTDDSVLIAKNFKIRSISSDGKYILAKNNRTIDVFSCSIINVDQKKYQVLIGRQEYYDEEATVVYSEEKQKFGFVVNDKVIYVDMPKTYPFDALSDKNPFFPYPEGLLEKFEKSSLKQY